MSYEFFLPSKALPNDFKYPLSYVGYVSGEFPDFDPWDFFHCYLEFRYQGLKERYPERTLVPFARRGDNDDVACFDASIPSDNPSVIIIHDFASPGWENHGTCKDFLEWLDLAKREAEEWNEL